MQTDEQASVKGRIFAELLAGEKTRLASQTATVDLLESQAHRGRRKITPELVERFAVAIRERRRGPDPTLRKAHIPLFVSEVALDAGEIKISGSKEAMAHAVSRIPTDGSVVPSFDREWCPMHHPIGHSDHWEIFIAR
ncbi:hypothetical protein [Sphingomonas sp. M1-B02]|uniref:hypothetical protein n=1 Tax=Sphingomonas sp. M1-B02 TaxID=3114300 RepID=UPI00223FB563|nr:hypothetical protein [Sphingomonas sp. S6-11]UZK66324.1 hypothetical protein OKW87_00325 [Sphingomonas sp. S6-11]